MKEKRLSHIADREKLPEDEHCQGKETAEMLERDFEDVAHFPVLGSYLEGQFIDYCSLFTILLDGGGNDWQHSNRP